MRGLDRTNLRTLSEVAPPGFKGTVRAMKAHGHTGKGKDKIDNPYALAWHMKNKGDKPHYKDQKTSKRGKPVKFKKYRDEDSKEETVSIFDDIIQEKELPDSFKKNMGKWKIKGGENPDAKKKGADYEGPDDDGDEDDKPDFLKDKDDSDCSEQSMFDDIVQESSGSLFDSLVESNNENVAEANWEDRVARTLTLTDELVSLRGSYKKQ